MKKLCTYLLFWVLLIVPSLVFGAVKPVFYSLSPFGTADISNDSPTIEITSGVATLSQAQTGNIGVGCDIDYGSGPTNVYIAPNRIPFNSGGTTELKAGDKIEGGTSGATGVVRAIELTGSGTWGGGDAAGYIYFSTSTGTWESEQINRTKPSSSSDIASCTGAIQGNIGNGNTQFVVKDPDGDDAANTGGSETVNSIHHEYISLNSFESGFTDGTHINNSNLVTANVIAHACCYYDHVGSPGDADTTQMVLYGWQNDADHKLYIFTPQGNAESINSQQHSGVYDDTKYLMAVVDNHCIYPAVTQNMYLRIDGLQLKVIINAASVYYKSGIRLEGSGAACNAIISDCIILADINNTSGGYHRAIYVKTATSTGYIYNCIAYDWDDDHCVGPQIDASATAYIYNCTFHNNSIGIYNNGGTCIIKNNIVNDCFTDYSGTFDAASTHNITDTTPAAFIAFGATYCSDTTDGDGTGSPGKLIDTADGDFINDGVQVGSIVAYGAGPSYTYVTAIDSATQLSVDTGIDTGVAYTIYTNMYGPVTFDAEGGDDFHLGSSDEVAIDKGTDLSTDANLPIWDDIDADARGATWDVGADEYIAPVGGLSIPILMYHYMHH